MIGLGGVVIGSAISIVTVFFNQRLIEKNEKRKEQTAREEQAITEVFSPLVFSLEKIREVFVGFATLQKVMIEIPPSKERDNAALLFTNLFVTKAEIHPKLLEELLTKKAGLMELALYNDLLQLYSYLDTVNSFFEMFTMFNEKVASLKDFLEKLRPLIVELDLAISQLRIYAGQRATRQNTRYSLFFDEKKIEQLELRIDEINKAITGLEVPDWDTLIKKGK